MPPPVSAVINTLNEEANIANAIRSLQAWVAEIIVVDMHSDDHTRDIATGLGAKVFLHQRDRFVEPARNFAINQATHDWIILLDADEMVPCKLAMRLLSIATSDSCDVVNIPMVNYLFGKAFQYTGWGPNQAKKRRFFKKAMIDFSPVIHVAPMPKEGSRELELSYAPDLAIIHFNYYDTSHFLEKLNRYTDIEAETLHAKGVRFSVFRMFHAVLRAMFERYFWSGGFREGWDGFAASVLMGMYNFSIWTKLRELSIRGGRAGIVSAYQKEADRIINGYLDPQQ